MSMGIVFGWILFCFVAGAIGSTRKIGFFGSFFLSLFMSPLVGIIVAMSSKRLDDIRHQEEIVNLLKSQREGTDPITTAQLSKLEELRRKKIISQSEFENKKREILQL